jgi:hypothetical protein
MYDWIIEADIYRLKKALLETGKGPSALGYLITWCWRRQGFQN